MGLEKADLSIGLARSWVWDQFEAFFYSQLSLKDHKSHFDLCLQNHWTTHVHNTCNEIEMF